MMVLGDGVIFNGMGSGPTAPPSLSANCGAVGWTVVWDFYFVLFYIHYLMRIKHI